MTDKFIPEEVKKQRLQILNDKVKEMSLKSNKKYVGKTMQILIDDVKEGVYQGRTRNNKVVHVKGEFKIGDFVDVEITHVSTWCLFANKK